MINHSVACREQHARRRKNNESSGDKDVPHVEKRMMAGHSESYDWFHGTFNTIAEIEPTDIDSVTLGVSWECSSNLDLMCAAIV